MVSLVKSIANVLGAASGQWNKRFTTDTAMNALREKAEEALAVHHESARLKGDLPGVDGFDKYAAGRISSIDGFSQIKSASGESIDKKLKETAVGMDIIGKINKALEPTKTTLAANGDTTLGFTKAQAEYRSTMLAVQTLVKKGDSSFSPLALIDYVYSVRDDAIAAIKRQQESEVTQLKALFDDGGFKIKFMAEMGIDGARYNQIQGEMLTTLQAKHTEELDKFTKEVNAPLEKLLETLNTAEAARLALLDSQLHQTNFWYRKTDTTKKIEELSRKSQSSPVEVSIDNETLSLKGIDIDDLQVLRSATGREITNTNGTLSMQIPDHFWSFAYHANSDDKLKLDIMSLVKGIQAKGRDKITFNISGMDADNAKECAMKAYEAAIEAGFKPENIVVRIEGQDKKPEDIFSGGNEYRLELAKNTFKEYDQSRKERQEKRRATSEHKTEILAIKDAAQKLRPKDTADQGTPTDVVARTPGGSTL
jgi:hypothetical protein